MAIDLLKYMIWKNGAGGGGASYEKTVGPAPIISIADAKRKPALSLIAGMEPIQEGSGDPSPDNIRPISGRTGANVYHSGADTADYETVSVPWEEEAGTVYGGTLDVTGGVLTVTHVYVDLGTLSWIRTTSYAHPFFYAQKLDYKRRTNVMCSGFAPIKPRMASGFGNDAADLSVTGGYDNSQIYVRYDAYSDAASFKSAVSGVVLVYQLATPQTYQLTLQQIQMLKGANVLWSDAGDLTLTYIGTQPAGLLGGGIRQPLSTAKDDNTVSATAETSVGEEE